MFSRALIFATQCHEGQFRKGPLKIPYIVHPIRVANLVLECSKEYVEYHDDLMTAAILHDVVEDCKVTLDDIKTQFDDGVAKLVGELTSDKEEIARIGKTRYLQTKMMKMSLDALLIKLCDRLDNISDFPWEEYRQSTFDIMVHLLAERKDLTMLHKKIIGRILTYVT